MKINICNNILFGILKLCKIYLGGHCSTSSFLVPEDQDNKKISGGRGSYSKGSTTNKSPKVGKDVSADGTPLFKGPKGPQGEKGGPRRRRTRYVILWLLVAIPGNF